MRVKTRLTINNYIALGVALLVLLALAWSYREVLQADANEELVVHMEKLAFERIILRDDYLLRDAERARIQWLDKTEELGKQLVLAERTFLRSADQATVKEARADFMVTYGALSEVMENRLRSKDIGAKAYLSDEAEKIILGQVFMKAYALNNDLGRLYESAERDSAAARNLAGLIIALFVMGGILIVVVNSTVISRILSRGLAELGRGVAILGSGDLDHRINIKGDNELSELGNASNAMAAKLKATTTSVENLRREVAERERTEELLRDQEFQLRETQRVGQIGSYVMDITTGTWTSSDILDGIFGIGSNDERSVASWTKLVHPDEREGMLQYLMQSVIREKKHFNREYRIVRQNDGAVRWVWGLGELSYDHNENPVKMIGVILDITERKRAEEPLQKKAEELRATNAELELFNRAAVGRELRMIELKEEINELCRRLGESPRHATDKLETDRGPVQARSRRLDDDCA